MNGRDSDEVAAGVPMLGSNSFPIPNSWAYFLGFDAITEPISRLLFAATDTGRGLDET